MRLVEMFVAIKDDEQKVLDRKFKNDVELKKFLEKQIDKAILLECEKIDNEEQVS